MDKIILNPPYLRNLYADICFVASHHGKEAVMLSPKGAILEKDRNSELSKHLTDFYDVSENSNGYLGFDIDLGSGSGLGIFQFDFSVNSDFYKSLSVEATHRKKVLDISNDETMFDRLLKKYTVNDVMSKHCKTYVETLYNPKRKKLIEKIDENKWYIGIPNIKGHREVKTGKIKWDYFTYIPIGLTEPIKGKVLGDWNNVIEFNSYEEGKRYIDYLNSDIAMFALWIKGKNSTSLKQYLSSVPYFIGEQNFTAEERQCISEVMKGFGNIWYYDKSMAEKGTVNLGHINCKVNFDWTDCVGEEKLFKK